MDRVESEQNRTVMTRFVNHSHWSYESMVLLFKAKAERGNIVGKQKEKTGKQAGSSQTIQ